MRADELRALAKRVSEATGPDRELDALIWEVMHVLPEYRTPEGVSNLLSGDRLPSYTASLDVAMTLVPERWTYVKLEVCARGLPGQHCRASAARYVGDDEEVVDGYGPTPALALTAVALLAHAATLTKLLENQDDR